MELITNASQLKKRFLNLLDEYSNYYFATAWAGLADTVGEKLYENRARISKLVVGIHFFQTHPDFLELFTTTKNAKAILQPSGTFHPKLFLFYNSDLDWSLLIGSANFTDARYSVEVEHVIPL